MSRTKVQSRPKTPNPLDVHVGGRLRTLRLIRGMSQMDLGRALGITAQQVHKYETGTNRVSASRLQKISEVFGTQAFYFFEGLAGSGIPTRDEQHDRLALPLSAMTAESIALNRAFHRIKDGQIRRRIIALVRALADDEDE
ncbi:MAG: helix-turn-helix transcriptional regulator [Shinella sp.]|nr:helix-turn-helix transcriptional regulator [Shinella sp.]